MMQRYVIHSMTFGVMLGTLHGEVFWSRINPGKQTTAPTFETRAEAEEFLHRMAWKDRTRDLLPAEWDLVEVSPDTNGFATQEACADRLLPRWH